MSALRRLVMIALAAVFALGLSGCAIVDAFIEGLTGVPIDHSQDEDPGPLGLPSFTFITADDESPQVGTPVTFSAYVIPSADDTPVWDFNGDGLYGPTGGEPEGFTVTHTFDTPGAHKVAIRVGTGGTISSADVTITVDAATPPPPPPPPPPAACSGLDFILYDEGTVPPMGDTLYATQAQHDGQAAPDATYQWDWEGDGTVDETVNSPGEKTHQYPAAGTYHPTVTVRDAAGDCGTHTVDVTVGPGRVQARAAAVQRFDLRLTAAPLAAGRLSQSARRLSLTGALGLGTFKVRLGKRIVSGRAVAGGSLRADRRRGRRVLTGTAVATSGPAATCLRYRLTARRRGRLQGTVTLLGGPGGFAGTAHARRASVSGHGARVRLRVRGTVSVQPAQAQALPAPCVRLLARAGAQEPGRPG